MAVLADGAMADALAAGVDEFWHDGMDVLEVLGRLHAELLG